MPWPAQSSRSRRTVEICRACCELSNIVARLGPTQMGGAEMIVRQAMTPGPNSVSGGSWLYRQQRTPRQ